MVSVYAFSIENFKRPPEEVRETTLTPTLSKLGPKMKTAQGYDSITAAYSLYTCFVYAVSIENFQRPPEEVRDHWFKKL